MAEKTGRIKILFTIPNFDTAGSGKALLKIATRLDPKIFDPQICCMHKRGEFFKVVEKSGFPIHIFKYTTPMKPYLKGVWHAYKISRKFRKIKPDIIHSFHYSPDYSEPLAARLAGIKWVYTKKNMNWGGVSKNSWKLRSQLADMILVQNTDMLKLFFQDSKKVELIPRGVDTNEFQPIKSTIAVRSLWKLAETQRVLICVANLVPVKGIEVLLEAFSKVVKNNPDWVLFIVGDNNNEYGAAMKDLSKNLGINRQVVFTGKQYNINEYLSIAEVFALPTLDKGRKEGSPVSLLEAMACEKYVLASNIPGIRDQLDPFPENLIAAGNIQAWEDALDKTLSKTKLELKSAGGIYREHVVLNYTIEKEVMRSKNLYMKVLGF